MVSGNVWLVSLPSVMFTCVLVVCIVCEKSKMKETKGTDEDWDDKFWCALGKASRQECVELTRSHQNDDQIAFYMITDDSLGNGKEQD